MRSYLFDVEGIEEQDRSVAWLPLVLLTLGSFLGGLYLVYSSLDQPRESQKRFESTKEAKQRKEGTLPASASSGRRGSPRVTERPKKHTSHAASKSKDIGSEVLGSKVPGSKVLGVAVGREAAPAQKAPMRIRPGRVAYFRCDGATLRKGAFPCPRDRNVEFAIWRSIKTLPSCSGSTLVPGIGELEVDFVRHHPPVLRMRAPKVLNPTPQPAAPTATLPLNTEGVRECIGDSLARLKQHVGAARLVISFRFEAFEAVR